MKLAILFWFYKHYDVCESRLKSLRYLNPNLKIFGLYGGPSSEIRLAQDRLGIYFDDFYAYTGEEDPAWKWKNGDLIIADWHKERGSSLTWDTIVLVQWDMLMLKPIVELFPTLRPSEALFSGFRPAVEVQTWWGWLKDDDAEKRQDRDAFVRWMQEVQLPTDELWCCLFIVVCLPRKFLDLYVAAGPPKVGFLEYKLPTLAKLWGIPICRDHSYEPWWASNPATRDAPPRARILNAVGQELGLRTALEEVVSASGISVVHPFRLPFPTWLSHPMAARLYLAVLRLVRAK